ALDGPGLFAGTAELVDVGEVAGVRPRQTEDRIALDLAVTQLGVLEAQAGVLQGGVVIGRLRPGHNRSLQHVERGSRHFLLRTTSSPFSPLSFRDFPSAAT